MYIFFNFKISYVKKKMPKKAAFKSFCFPSFFFFIIIAEKKNNFKNTFSMF